MQGRKVLVIAGSLSLLAGFAHVLIVFGGASWYRFFGAGEEMARLAETGSLQPALITFFIAIVLMLWGALAFSAAGLIARLPLLKVSLVLISGVYLSRGLLGLILPFVITHPILAQNSLGFWLVSSSICCAYGFFYSLGTWKAWQHL